MEERERCSGNEGIADETKLALQAAGLTLVGVLLSIGVTVGMGLGGAWWVRLLAGAGTTVGLTLAVWFLGTRTHLLARLAEWITGRSYIERG